ncbi:MAG: transposase domain-containing protein, partial [bacterium]|nr:transposase domain-containing protein [bacterium]
SYLVRFFRRLEVACKFAIGSCNSIPHPRDARQTRCRAAGARHDVDPYAWLRDVLARIPTIRMSELEMLLPDQWADSDTLASRAFASA